MTSSSQLLRVGVSHGWMRSESTRLGAPADDLVRLNIQFCVDELQKLLHVSQQFLADSLARAVDA